MAKNPRLMDRINPRNPLTAEQMILRRDLQNIFFVLCPEALRYTEREVGKDDKKKTIRQARDLGWVSDKEAAGHSADTLWLKKVLWAMAYGLDQIADIGEIFRAHRVLLSGMLEMEKIPEGKRAAVALKYLAHLDSDRAAAIYSTMWLGGLKGKDTARGKLLAVAEEAGYNKPFRVWVADGKLKGSDDAEAASRILSWIVATAGGNKPLIKAFATVVDEHKLLTPEERARLTALQGGGATIGEAIAAQGKSPPVIKPVKTVAA